MIKSKLATKIMLGLLLATPYTAFANSIGTVMVDGVETEINVNSDFNIGNETVKDVQITAQNSSASLSISDMTDGTINGEYITLDGGISITSGAASTPCGTVTIGSEGVTNTVNINGNASDGLFIRQGHVNIEAENINISTEAEGNYGGIWVQNNTQDANAPEGAASLKLNAENINVNAVDLGIVAFSNSQIDINGNLTVNADHAIDTRGNATININTDGAHTTVLNGDIVFETPATAENAQNSGNLINSYVNINLNGEGSSWTGRAYQVYADADGNPAENIELNSEPYYGNVTGFKMSINNGAEWNMTGDSFINEVTVADGGAINVQENAEKLNVGSAKDGEPAADGGLTLNNGVINLQGENQQVNVAQLNGTGGTVNTNSLDNKMFISNANEETAVTVNGSGEIADAIYGGEATVQQLAEVVTTGTGADEKSAASKISTDEGIIAGKISADVNADGEVTNTVYTQNTTNVGISNMAAINLMTWRQENNDMNKRLGELRDSKGEHGVWARMVRGEVEYESVKNQYNYYQVGYDEKLSTDPNWTVGMFLTRTEGNSSFRTGSAENNHTGVGVYGSYLKDDGSFIDLVAKYARIDSDFNATGGVGSGDYNTNGYSISAEYGKRFEQGNGFWIEPQVELTYGTVGAVDYTTSSGAEVRQESMDSVVGRVGFSLGKDIKAGNVYARASYLYDFDGETEVTMSHGGVSDVYEQDLGGGWFEVGIGTNINLSDATHLYFDVEKTYGGDVATPWQWSAGVRYSF